MPGVGDSGKKRLRRGIERIKPFVDDAKAVWQYATKGAGAQAAAEDLKAEAGKAADAAIGGIGDALKQAMQDPASMQEYVSNRVRELVERADLARVVQAAKARESQFPVLAVHDIAAMFKAGAAFPVASIRYATEAVERLADIDLLAMLAKEADAQQAAEAARIADEAARASRYRQIALERIGRIKVAVDEAAEALPRTVLAPGSERRAAYEVLRRAAAAKRDAAAANLERAVPETAIESMTQAPSDDYLQFRPGRISHVRMIGAGGNVKRVFDPFADIAVQEYVASVGRTTQGGIQNVFAMTRASAQAFARESLADESGLLWVRTPRFGAFEIGSIGNRPAGGRPRTSLFVARKVSEDDAARGERLFAHSFQRFLALDIETGVQDIVSETGEEVKAVSHARRRAVARLASVVGSPQSDAKQIAFAAHAALEGEMARHAWATQVSLVGHTRVGEDLRSLSAFDVADELDVAAPRGRRLSLDDLVKVAARLKEEAAEQMRTGGAVLGLNVGEFDIATIREQMFAEGELATARARIYDDLLGRLAQASGIAVGSTERLDELYSEEAFSTLVDVLSSDKDVVASIRAGGGALFGRGAARTLADVLHNAPHLADGARVSDRFIEAVRRSGKQHRKTADTIEGLRAQISNLEAQLRALEAAGPAGHDAGEEIAVVRSALETARSKLSVEVERWQATMRKRLFSAAVKQLLDDRDRLDQAGKALLETSGVRTSGGGWKAVDDVGEATIDALDVSDVTKLFRMFAPAIEQDPEKRARIVRERALEHLSRDVVTRGGATLRSPSTIVFGSAKTNLATQVAAMRRSLEGGALTIDEIAELAVSGAADEEADAAARGRSLLISVLSGETRLSKTSKEDRALLIDAVKRARRAWIEREAEDRAARAAAGYATQESMLYLVDDVWNAVREGATITLGGQKRPIYETISHTAAVDARVTAVASIAATYSKWRETVERRLPMAAGFIDDVSQTVAEAAKKVGTLYAVVGKRIDPEAPIGVRARRYLEAGVARLAWEGRMQDFSDKASRVGRTFGKAVAAHASKVAEEASLLLGEAGVAKAKRLGRWSVVAAAALLGAALVEASTDDGKDGLAQLGEETMRPARPRRGHDVTMGGLVIRSSDLRRYSHSMRQDRHDHLFRRV